VNALASYPTVGYQGQLTGEEGLEEHMEPEPGRLVDRVVTDTFANDEQWERFQKSGGAKAQKARDKRRAKEVNVNRKKR